MIYAIKNVIRESIIENRVFLDYDDVDLNAEIIYPLVYNVVFNSNLSVRYDEEAIIGLIDYLVVHVA